MEILSAMITPAVLILACSSLLLATSNRLGRVLERARSLSVTIREDSEKSAPAMKEKREHDLDQLSRTTKRGRLLQRAMTNLYFSLAFLLLTSLALGVQSVLGKMTINFYLIALGFISIGSILSASIFLILESRVALKAVNAEMDFALNLIKKFTPRPPK